MDWYKTTGHVLIAIHKELSIQFEINYDKNINLAETTIDVDNLKVFDHKKNKFNYFIECYISSADRLQYLYNAKEIIPLCMNFVCDVDHAIHLLFDQQIFIFWSNMWESGSYFYDLRDIFKMISKEQIINDLHYIYAGHEMHKEIKKWMKDIKKNYIIKLENSIKEIKELVYL